MPEVNGQQYQHATVRPVAVSTGGTFKLKTFTKISYKVKAPKEATNDAQGEIDGFVIRKEEHEASITLKLSEWFEFRQWLLSQNPGLGVLQCQFDLPVSYGPRLGALKTDTLRTVMVNEEPRESEDGQDVLTVELPLFFLKPDLADGPAMVYDQ
jgi:hypothetical protein